MASAGRCCARPSGRRPSPKALGVNYRSLSIQGVPDLVGSGSAAFGAFVRDAAAWRHSGRCSRSTAAAASAMVVVGGIAPPKARVGTTLRSRCSIQGVHRLGPVRLVLMRRHHARHGAVCARPVGGRQSAAQ